MRLLTQAGDCSHVILLAEQNRMFYELNKAGNAAKDRAFNYDQCAFDRSPFIDAINNWPNQTKHLLRSRRSYLF
jgi:hypothetical protein